MPGSARLWSCVCEVLNVSCTWISLKTLGVNSAFLYNPGPPVHCYFTVDLKKNWGEIQWKRIDSPKWGGPSWILLLNMTQCESGWPSHCCVKEKIRLNGNRSFWKSYLFFIKRPNWCLSGFRQTTRGRCRFSVVPSPVSTSELAPQEGTMHYSLLNPC